MDSYDWCCDVFGVVYDLVDSGNTLGNVHAGYSCEVECFQGHLSCRFTYTLSG